MILHFKFISVASFQYSFKINHEINLILFMVTINHMNVAQSAKVQVKNETDKYYEYKVKYKK